MVVGGWWWCAPLSQDCFAAEIYLCRNSYSIFPTVWIHLWAAQLEELGGVCLLGARKEGSRCLTFLVCTNPGDPVQEKDPCLPDTRHCPLIGVPGPGQV